MWETSFPSPVSPKVGTAGNLLLTASWKGCTELVGNEVMDCSPLLGAHPCERNWKMRQRHPGTKTKQWRLHIQVYAAVSKRASIWTKARFLQRSAWFLAVQRQESMAQTSRKVIPRKSEREVHFTRCLYCLVFLSAPHAALHGVAPPRHSGRKKVTSLVWVRYQKMFSANGQKHATTAQTL